MVSRGGALLGGEQKDAPGPYVVVHNGAVVKAMVGSAPGAKVVARLAYGTPVMVLEVALVEKEQRLRGRIEDPPGWISLLNTQDGHRWAKPQGPGSCDGGAPSPGLVSPERPRSPAGGRQASPAPVALASAVGGKLGSGHVASKIAARAWDGDGVPLAESNCAGIGGDEDKAVRKAAAAKEPAWIGAGTKPGVLIWRIEQFKVVLCDPKQFGKFHKGDSYIILETFQDQDSHKLLHHIYFWLGSESTLDEMGTAAYKTVELDDLLGGEPTQSREVMGKESQQFKALFPALTYLDGGVETGFHHVGPDQYMPRLMHVRKTSHGVLKKEVTLSRDSLNEGDCFVLDAGKVIYVWVGSESSRVEQFEANLMVSHIKLERHGHVSKAGRCDDEFWRLLGGKGPIKSAAEGSDDVPDPQIGEGVLYRMHAVGDDLELEEVGRFDLHPSQLDSGHVMVLDHVDEVCIWVGSRAPAIESRNALSTAARFLSVNGRSTTTPIHMYREGAAITNPLWESVFRD